jgi:ribosomal protein RSM22 (predicted rRNA methylase)
MEMNWDAIDWKALERVRITFLQGLAGTSDYWQSESDLASYDATFAQRIGWKWDYVLEELSRRGWSPAHGELLDWGCGSGIASRAFLDHFGPTSTSKLHLWDRSLLAMRFAAKRAREKYPGLEASVGLGGSAVSPDQSERRSPTRHETRAASEINAPRVTLLISHVLTELTPEQIETLADSAARATSVIWIEPGTYQASRALIGIRERLRDRFNVIAPCTHQTRCGILAPGNHRHWCHHFATPPPDVFTDGNWARFASLMGIDLRDLPLSFLVLDQRPAPALPAGAARVIGHPRVYKAHALLLGCDASGVSEHRLMKRALPEEFRRWKQGAGGALQAWRCDGDEIVESKAI